MPTIRHAYVDTRAGQVHLHEVGGTGTPILFLHQTALSARSYDPLLRVLDVPNRLVAIDTPGFGGSCDLQGWPALDEYADILLEAIDALGVDRVHIYGHHTGATLAIEMAARAAQRVTSLMLSGPVFMTEQEREDFIAGYSAPIAPVADGSHLLRNWNYAAQNNPDCPLDVLQEATVDQLRAWRARPQAYMAVAQHDTAARAAQVKAPVVLMTTAGDFFHAAFDRAVALFPKAQVVQTGGDNFPSALDPHGVTNAIKGFLAGL